MDSAKHLHGLRVVGLVLWVLAASCFHQSGASWNPLAAFGDLSADQERELGMEFDHELQQRIPIIHDPVVAGFLHDLGQRIVTQVEPQPFIYRFRVISDPSLNAFAVPGGYIYFHSGTILSATSVDEVAAVMGHEIAHVRARHHDRMRQRSQLPDLLTGVAGIGAAVLTGDTTPLVASQAANVALKLSYSRDLEAEADELGAVYVARAGFEPEGSARFFQRILDGRDSDTASIPPYLFSHPEVENRIEDVRARAAALRPVGDRPVELELAFRRAQARLAQLVSEGRVQLANPEREEAPEQYDALLADVTQVAESGEPALALAQLRDAGGLRARDPRVAFLMGDLSLELDHLDEAIEAYRRAIELDSSRALVFYKLGLAYKRSGDRQLAVYNLEQAMQRAGGRGVQERARFEVLKLTFGVLVQSGFADGNRGPRTDTPAGNSVSELPAGSHNLAWWGRVSPHLSEHASRLRVRWIDPEGLPLPEQNVERAGRGYVTAVRKQVAELAPGEWILECHLDDDLVDRQTLLVRGS